MYVRACVCVRARLCVCVCMRVCVRLPFWFVVFCLYLYVRLSKSKLKKDPRRCYHHRQIIREKSIRYRLAIYIPQ